MYIFFTHLHHLLSWLVLLAAIFALYRSWTGYIAKKAWLQTDNTAGLIFTILVDIQVLTGLILYVFLSPLTKTAFYDFGAAMKNPLLRFYAVEHILVMLIALALIHIGRSKAKKAANDLKKHTITAIFFTIAFVLILSRTPWEKLFKFF
jgi:hypothetical protein